MDWRRALLRNLGAPPSQENLTFLSTWQRWEGGHTNNSAKWNWLNTTHGPGSSINSVGVKAFPNFKTGIKALTETLNNGRYADILDALASGNPYAAAPAAGLQTWVSGRPDGNPAYAHKILGGYSGGTGHRDKNIPMSPPMVAPGFDPDFKLAKVLFGFDTNFIEQMENLRKRAGSDMKTGVSPDGSPITSPVPTGSKGGGGSAVREMFYDPAGAYDEGSWISPIGGHSDHVHVSFGTPQAAMAIIRKAQSMGLRASENPWAEGSAPEQGVHTGTSYHYQTFGGKYKGGKSPTLGRALDVSGSPDKMLAFFNWVKKAYGLGGK